MLARREYGRAELRARLIARGAARDEVERALDELQTLGYLSDARFAHSVVANRSGRYSKRAIAHELKQKQVDGDAAAAALAELPCSDEVAEALALLRKRFDAPPADDREKARQLRFLLSRGYSTGVAFKVLRFVGARAEDD